MDEAKIVGYTCPIADGEVRPGRSPGGQEGLAARSGVFGGGSAIVGIGVSSTQEDPNWRGEDYALDAARRALADAGLRKDSLDGLITCKALGGGGVDTVMGRLLGLNPTYSASLDYGTCNFSIHLAAMVISAGLARTILLTYGTDQGSRGGDFSAYGGENLHHGVVDTIGTLAALMFRRYQHLYGASEADLGAVVVAQRRWAALNPTAAHREPMTIESYLAEPYYIVRCGEATSPPSMTAALLWLSPLQTAPVTSHTRPSNWPAWPRSRRCGTCRTRTIWSGAGWAAWPRGPFNLRASNGMTSTSS